MSFQDGLEITITFADKTRACADMPIVDEIRQQYGYVHGGATISLLETVAGACVEKYVDLTQERPFGTHLDIHHIKTGKNGVLHAKAVLDAVEGGNKYIFHGVVRDDEGDVISTGKIVYRVVTLERLREKEAQYAAEHGR